MSSRLSQLSRQLIAEEPPIEAIRRKSTIDKDELKHLAYGPCAKYRDRIFTLMRSRRDIFDHSFIQEYDRKAMRKKCAEQLIALRDHCPLSYSEFV